MKNFESLKRMATKFSREKMKTINGGMQWKDQRTKGRELIQCGGKKQKLFLQFDTIPFN